MKKLQLIVLIISFWNCYSQIKSGVVSYGTSVMEKKDSQLEKMMLSMNPNYYSITKEFEFKLKFNKEKSIFLKTEKTYSDDDAAKMGTTKVGFLGNFLTKNDTVFREGNSLSIGNYIVYKNLNKDWILLNESKLIDNYLCFKATTENIIINLKGTFKHPIIAWYCPQIPFSYGPIGYGGLPGLILELQTEDAVYGVKEMKLNTIDMNIEDLKKYKKYNEKELNDLIQKKNASKPD